jgi:tetratricopeptide (TPR) repeat protein
MAAMNTRSPSEADPLDAVVESFLQRYRRGEHPTVTEYVERYPDLAERIRETFPALAMIEELGSVGGPAAAAAPIDETIAPLASPPGYELRDEIGRGGMGVVYRARDTALDRDVAVKLLSNRYPVNSPVAQRFLNEARITGQLQHPGIPAVHQVGALADGRPFLAMKLIKGSTLEAILKQWADPAAEHGRLLAIFEAVCQAVGYAHAHRVIHRDLKPANVMVSAFGEVQVMDWGLAKVLGEVTHATGEARSTEETRAWTEVSPTPEAGSHTQTGSLVGTPAFIGPEQALGEIDKVNERSDVFGLGALLAVILTGKPPYVGETADSVRVQAARGKLEDCFARLDASSAEPELLALCKRCLAFEPAERPADAGAVATAVAGLRAAADERARRAELERVRVEGEQATALARSAERRKRRRLVIGAAAALALAAVGGLAVQRQANIELEAKNAALAEQQAEVEARFETAQKAIATFHTGVSEDFLLKNEQFKELRTKLLKEAADFYSDLEKLLAGKTDTKSRKLLAAGYFQLGELTAKIGDQKEALAVQRKALSLRRELAAAPSADVETRLDVTRSLAAVGNLLKGTDDKTGALTAYEEQRDLAATLEPGAPTDAVSAQMAAAHHGIAWVLSQMGKPDEALKEYRRALTIRQRLADANPGHKDFQRDLGKSHNNMAMVLSQTGKPDEALKEFQEARDIYQKLAKANPGVADFESDLASGHNNVGWQLSQMTGKLAEALLAHQKALAIRQKLAVDNPAVTDFQSKLSYSYYNIGNLLGDTGKRLEGLKAHQKALAIRKKLADDNPTVTDFQNDLAMSHNDIALLLLDTRMPAEALQEHQKALAIRKKLADDNPAVMDFQSNLGFSHNNIGTVLYWTGKLSDAMKEFQQGLAIRKKLADANLTVTDFQISLAESHNNVAILLNQTGNQAEAVKEYQKALALRKKLADANPDITQYQKDLAGSHNAIGSMLLSMGMPTEALKELQKALDIQEKLAAVNATVTEFQNNLALTYENIGRLHARAKRFTEAFAALDRGLAIAQSLADVNLTNPEYTYVLCHGLASRGLAHARAGHPAEAAADLRRALSLWGKKKSPSNDIFERGRSLALLAGLAADAKSGVTAAEAAAFADKAVAALRDALQGGLRNVDDDLKTPDFDPLRGREDFKKLLAEWQTKSRPKAKPKN